MKKLLILPIMLILYGCAINPNVQNIIGPPSQVQAEVAVLGSLAKIEIPASDAPKIHQFATSLATATSIDTTILIGLIPHTGHPKTDALIQAGAAFVSLALSHYSTSDPVTIQYAHAVGNGLLVSFP